MGCCNSTEVRNVQYGEDEFCFMSLAVDRQSLYYGLLLLPRQIKRDWKPLEERSCTDIPWLIIFVLFCIGMVYCYSGIIYRNNN